MQIIEINFIEVKVLGILKQVLFAGHWKLFCKSGKWNLLLAAFIFIPLIDLG